MPGAKGYVSVAYEVHKQKRLLLFNLKELYAAYKNKFIQSKIGFSKFVLCALSVAKFLVLLVDMLYVFVLSIKMF